MKNALGTAAEGSSLSVLCVWLQEGAGSVGGEGGGSGGCWRSSVNKGASISLDSFAGTKYHGQ